MRPPLAPGNWVDDAACRGRDMSLPHGSQAKHAGYADRHGLRTICAGCPVFAQCEAWAMTYPDPATDHLAAGMTPQERRNARGTPQRRRVYEHGTNAGYSAHLRYDDTPCGSCREAHAAHEAEARERRGTT